MLKWNLHVDSIISKANSRNFFLMVLKHCGFDLHDLVKCYCTFVRPISEYTASVAPRSHQVPDRTERGRETERDRETERQRDRETERQRQTLRNLLPKLSCREALFTTVLQTLDQWRVKLCSRFAVSSMSWAWLAKQPQTNCYAR